MEDFEALAIKYLVKPETKLVLYNTEIIPAMFDKDYKLQRDYF